MDGLGILGGMGPMATAYFMQKIVEITDVDKDQQHIEMYVAHCPDIPDRTAYLLGGSEKSPLPRMLEEGKKLLTLGVREIAVPCVTSFYFHRELEDELQVPVRHGVLETARNLALRGVDKAGIMATDGTVKMRLMDEVFGREGIQCVYPSSQGQEWVMDMIYREIKAGKMPDEKLFLAVSQELCAMGAQCIVLGCTELSLCRKWFSMEKSSAEVVDVLEILARTCVNDFGLLREVKEG